MTTSTELRELALRWIEATVAYDRLVAIPFLDRPSTDDARLAVGEAFRAYAAARGFRTGDRVSLLPGAASKEASCGLADVVRVNSETVTVERLFDGKTYRVDPKFLRANYYDLELEAKALLEVDEDLPVVVIPCGGRKTPYAAPAQDFYVGSYFRAMLAAARSLTSDDLIFVLSGKHGFVSLSTELEPYEQRIDEPGAVSAEDLRRDVALAPALDDVFAARRSVVVLAGSAYAGRAVEAFGSGARIVLPFEGARGIGDHLARAKELREADVELDEPDPGAYLRPDEVPSGEPCSHLEKPLVHRGSGHLNDGPALLCPGCGAEVELEAFQRAAAKELLEASRSVGQAGSSDRWSKAVERYLDVVGFRPGDRAYVSGRAALGPAYEPAREHDPRFGKVTNIVGRDEDGNYLVTFDEAEEGSAPAKCPAGWLRPIVADLLTAAGEVLDSDLEPVAGAPADESACRGHHGPGLPGSCALCGEARSIELETVALLAGEEVVSIGTDEQGRQKLRLRSELELPDEERSAVMREGLIFLADDVEVPACDSCDGERVVFRSGQMVPCPECVDEVAGSSSKAVGR
jgi:hypothetical protein